MTRQASPARAIRRLKLVRIPKAGHITCIENPAAFTQALEEFFGALAA
jgi:pimeloyl-ACP methyl ester carboxylesterase